MVKLKDDNFRIQSVVIFKSPGFDRSCINLNIMYNQQETIICLADKDSSEAIRKGS